MNWCPPGDWCVPFGTHQLRSSLTLSARLTNRARRRRLFQRKSRRRQRKLRQRERLQGRRKPLPPLGGNPRRGDPPGTNAETDEQYASRTARGCRRIYKIPAIAHAFKEFHGDSKAILKIVRQSWANVRCYLQLLNECRRQLGLRFFYPTLSDIKDYVPKIWVRAFNEGFHVLSTNPDFRRLVSSQWDFQPMVLKSQRDFLPKHGPSTSKRQRRPRGFDCATCEAEPGKPGTKQGTASTYARKESVSMRQNGRENRTIPSNDLNAGFWSRNFQRKIDFRTSGDHVSGTSQ